MEDRELRPEGEWAGRAVGDDAPFGQVDVGTFGQLYRGVQVEAAGGDGAAVVVALGVVEALELAGGQGGDDDVEAGRRRWVHGGGEVAGEADMGGVAQREAVEA